MCFSAESAFPPGPALVAQSYPFLRLFAVHQVRRAHLTGAMHGPALPPAAPSQAYADAPQRDFAPITNASGQCWWNHDPRPAGDSAYVCNAWMASTPATNGLFSAVCLFTALQVAAKVRRRRGGGSAGGYADSEGKAEETQALKLP